MKYLTFFNGDIVNVYLVIRYNYFNTYYCYIHNLGSLIIHICYHRNFQSYVKVNCLPVQKNLYSAQQNRGILRTQMKNPHGFLHQSFLQKLIFLCSLLRIVLDFVTICYLISKNKFILNYTESNIQI